MAKEKPKKEQPEERRVTLNEKQFAALADASQKAAAAQARLNELQEVARTVFALIADALGVPDNAQVRIDEKTRELVWQVADPGVAEAPKAAPLNA